MTNPIDIIHAVNRSLKARSIEADINVRVEPGNVVVLSAAWETSTCNQRGEISTRFTFDGDLVLMRGLGAAMDNIAWRINQARHQGLTVR